jgi:hypothetical protein
MSKNHLDIHNKALLVSQFFSSANNRQRLGFTAGTLYGNWYANVFTPIYEAYIEAFNAWDNPLTCTDIVRSAFKTAEKAFIAVYRELRNMLNNNPGAKDDDLLEMGYPPVPRRCRTTAPVATTHPVSVVTSPEPATLEFRCGDETGATKPNDRTYGVETALMISDIPIDDPELLVHSYIHTRTRFRITFDFTRRGRNCYYAHRWVNTTGKKGPWSTVACALIT